MICPACNHTLSPKKINSTEVDVCENGCGGIWFDQLELMKFDEPHETSGEALLEVSAGSTTVIDHDKKRTCPRCEHNPMMRHFHSVKCQIEVDECPACAGFWLDLGELQKVRSAFSSTEERNKAAVKHLESVFATDIKQMQNESAENLKKAKRIGNIFRWICPSYWIPGDQDGLAH